MWQIKYKDFKSSLEFLTNYGFEYGFDLATDKRECYRNNFGEIILEFVRTEPNEWTPQICVEINCWKKVIDVKEKCSELDLKQSKNIYDTLHNIAKKEAATKGKVLDILVHPKHLKNS